MAIHESNDPLVLLLVVCLILSACGSGAETGNDAPKHRTSNGDTTAAQGSGTNSADPLDEEATRYAEDHDVPHNEALRRLRLQERYADDLGRLEARLRENEADTYAGLWIQHEPAYRYVALFIRDGTKIIRPYIRGEPYAKLIEARSGADATLAQLHVAQKEVGRIIETLNYPAATGIDVRENRAEVYVTDRARFEAALREANEPLPQHVGVVEVESLMTPH